jgi:spermidine synthase
MIGRDPTHSQNPSVARIVAPPDCRTFPRATIQALYRIIFLFFFLSGLSSLVFEVLWERMLMQVFGSTSFAISTLLTAFMAGMALGSWIGGKYADDMKKPLLTYGFLEGGIGAYALVVPLLLDLLPTVYGAMFDTFLDNFYVFSLLRFVAVFLILLVPTTMMGATLPIVSQWVSRHQKMFQGSIGLLYGVNTFGACVGCAIAGFVLLPWLGLSTTNVTFAIVNFALCGIVVLAHRFGLDDLEAGSFEEDEADVGELEELEEVYGHVSETSEPIPRWAVWAALGSFAVFGAISMSYQVLWTRAFVIILGSSTYSFTIILTAFLIGLSGGSAALSPLVKRIKRPLFWLGLVQMGVAASATIAFFVLDKLPVWLFHRLREQITDPNEIYVYYFFLVGVVVLIPTFLQGMTFPLVIRAAVQDRERSGKLVGTAYAFNTGGSIIGSFAAGFILMPWIGLNAAITAVIVLNLVVAIAIAAVELRLVHTVRKLAYVGLAAVMAVGVFFASPSIDRIGLTRGMFRAYFARELFDPEKLAKDSPELVFYEDGLNATITVEKRGELYTLKANGKPEASDGADMATQVIVGLMPYIVRAERPDVEVGDEESVMIGFGSGVTAGAALQWPLGTLEVIEIEEAMIEASHFFDHVNNKPLEDQRMTVIESDGRNYLEYTDKKYDVIVSEPSNPWIAGVSALFTVEHFRRAKGHLEPGGVFGQWVQLYEMRPDNVKVIIATFLDVFPHVQAFSSKPKSTDIILVGSDEPIPVPNGGYERAWSIDSVREELQRVGIRHPDEFYGLMFMSEEELHQFAEGAPLNTDDNGLLEFEAPKDLIMYNRGEKFFTDVYVERTIYGDVRPYLTGWPDGEYWTVENVGSLARAQWLGGKPEFSKLMMEEAGYGQFDALPDPIAPPFDAAEDVLLAHHARGLDRDEAVVREWPYGQTELYGLLVDAIRGEKINQLTRYIESQGYPKAGGYDGERGLVYAFLLAKRRYFKDAREQLLGLQEDAEFTATTSLPYQLLLGYIEEKRLNYAASYDAYVEAGRSRVD